MNDLPMITRILIGALLIAAVLAAILARESKRERDLRSWIAKRRGARLYWPLEMDAELPVPFRELVGLTLGRQPLAWGAAVQIERSADQTWFLECRTTPPGRETADWFTLVVRGTAGDAPDPAAWQCHLLDDVLSVEILNQVLAHGASVAPDPAQDDEGVTGKKE
jgi:hypothetical protein